MLEEFGVWLRSQFLCHSRNLVIPAGPLCFLRIWWKIGLSQNTKATIAPHSSVPINDVAQLSDKSTEITPPPCIARLSSSSFQINVLTAKLKRWASSRSFRERLCLVFTIASKMETPDFFAVCRTVTSPRHLLAPPPF